MTRPDRHFSGSAAPRGRAPQPAWMDWLDRNSAAKAVGGTLAGLSGTGPGFARGAWHLVEGAGEGLNFFGRLLDPYDAQSSPRGQAAWDAVIDAGRQGIRYLHRVRTNPSTVLNDAHRVAEETNAKINPAAARQGDTFRGELRRNFDLGLNRGEALFDVGSVLFGGAELKGLAELGLLQKSGTAKYLARGYPRGLSEYFATPYDGVGHHYRAQSKAFPKTLGGGPVPRILRDSPFNVLKPTGVDRGAFYERHFKVDPSYYGGKIPAEFGGGRWSGRDLGWQKYGPLGRGFYGAPGPLKATGGAGLAGIGALVDAGWQMDPRR